MTIVLVGNKKDLAAQRQVSYEEGLEFARRNKLIFFETSAKTAENVDETFVHATKIIYNNVVRGDVYDLGAESIGIKPGNVNPNRHAAAIAATQLTGGVTRTEKRKREGGCC